MADSTRALLSLTADQIVAARKKSNRGVLTFPAGLGVHCTLMRFFEYKYGGTMGSTENNIADIVLPLPRQIQDSFKINVAGDELGILATAAAQVSSNPSSLGSVTSKLSSGVMEAAKNIGTDIGGGDFSKAATQGTDVTSFLVRAGLDKIAPDIANGISAGRGTAVNPFATLTFKGVDLKVHSLEWLLSPESEEESRTLKDIIQTLQSMVLPKIDSAIGQNTTVTAIDRGLMRYPAMVDIYFQGIDMDYYFKFKTSMISQLNVDYTPNGIAINRGGRPSAIRISMTLNEAYIHTSDDYDNMDTSIEALNEDATLRAPLLSAANVLYKPDSGTAVPAADGQSDAQTPTDENLTDEYRVQTGRGGLTVTRTKDELNADGITDEDISADPEKYAPAGN